MNPIARGSLPAALLVSLAFIPAAYTGDPSGSPAAVPASARFVEGEELVYEVSWWVVHLGTIRVRVVDVARDSAGTHTRARADIDSYPELPFADLHVMTETVMDSGCTSEWFLGITQDNGRWKTIRYNYAAERNLLRIERGTTTDREDRDFSVERTDTLPIGPHYQDGLSIFYFARANLGSGREVSAPTVIEGAAGRTVFNFDGKRTGEEIDAVAYPVDVVGFSGKAEFSGIFGLSGDFDGWFSNDEARIPICANLDVVLGSVRVELISWHREGWKPPRSPGE